MERKDGTIDLGALLALVLREKKRVAAIMASCLVIAIVLAFILPKQYESTVLVRAKAPGQNGLSAAAGAMAALGLGGNVSTPTMAYIELMKSRSVLEPVIEALDLEPEVKEKLTAKEFSRNCLDLVNMKGTDLIEVTATGRSPKEAHQIADGVVMGFQHMMTTLNQNDQSLMLTFLTDRMEIAKKEMETAVVALEAFRQQEKIYIPDEQSKAVIEKVVIYDKLVGEAQINRDMAAVRLREVKEQLAGQNAALMEFNLTDHPGIQKMRDAMIEKQIELVDLRQKYTDRHPSVENLNQQIDALHAQIKKEVEASVQAGTNTLNPVHAGLLQARIETETAILVSEKQLENLQNFKSQAEQEINRLSAAGMQYIALDRDAKTAAAVYELLVKNYEQARIQKAMDSMDIQIVDAANLPVEASAPRKLLIVLLGIACGGICCGGYIYSLYRRS